jgi:DNA-binding PadR family transcriptional regulator
MPPIRFLGEFEQMLLLAIIQTDGSSNAFEIRRELEESAGRRVSKGSFYTTLDRLETKGFLTWKAAQVEGERGGRPQRFFEVTPEGIAALRRSRSALLNLWRGLDAVLE